MLAEGLQPESCSTGDSMRCCSCMTYFRSSRKHWRSRAQRPSRSAQHLHLRLRPPPPVVSRRSEVSTIPRWLQRRNIKTRRLVISVFSARLLNHSQMLFFFPLFPASIQDIEMQRSGNRSQVRSGGSRKTRRREKKNDMETVAMEKKQPSREKTRGEDKD